jgi:hypothetical protein
MMGFDFSWDNADKTVIRYRAEGAWTWNDFHKHVRRSTFALDALERPVETIFDLGASARLPAGAIGHLRSIGKQDHAKRRPRAVVIGVPESLQAQLGARGGVYESDGQLIHFVRDGAEARAVVAAWLAGDAEAT